VCVCVCVRARMRGGQEAGLCVQNKSLVNKT
jgi:hypothetical protein